MSLDFAHASVMLQEMGIGPIWVRRGLDSDVPATEAGQLTQEAVAHESVAPSSAKPVQPAPRPITVAVPPPSTPEPLQSLPTPAMHAAVKKNTPDMPDLSDMPWDDDTFAPPPFEPGAGAPVSLDELFDIPFIDADDSASSEERHLAAVAKMNWQALEQAVAKCTRCTRCETRSRPVFGSGAQKTQWLLVGDAPVQEDEKAGAPFAGRAGTLLDNMLRAVGLDRSKDAYLTPVVKCRAQDGRGNERPPTPDEIKACMPYLHRQIALIEPQVILALGQHAGAGLLEQDLQSPMERLREEAHVVDGRVVVVSHAPQYLVQHPQAKAESWRDLLRAKLQHNSQAGSAT